jgi:SprT protein
MPTAETLTNQIRSFVPEDAVDMVVRWISDHKIVLTITNTRNSVFGDYRWPQNGKGHRISVNGDLNQYAFLITFVHEMAHLTTWEKFRNTVSSHGKEWKQEFKLLMDEFAGKRIFPPDIRTAFKEHLLSPSFSHCVDQKLMRALLKYDSEQPTLLEELPKGSLFQFKKQTYRKGEQLRKRFQCIEVKTKRLYLFNPIAPVKRIES